MSQTSPFLHQQAWRATFEGYDIVDCAIRSRHIIYLVLRRRLPQEQASHKRDFDIPTRLAALFVDETDPDEQWSHQGVEGFAQPRCGAARQPIAQGMVAGLNGDVLAMGSSKREMEKMVEDDRPTAVRKIRTLFDQAYAVSLGREIYRRDGVARWTRLGDGFDPFDLELIPDLGFEDIDGFTANDMYAVGGQGDVWHFDGKEWSSCDFPTNWPLYTVCCAPDGHVYISGEGGRIYRGRDDQWQQIWDNELAIPYNDTLWFDDKLWLASDYQLHQLVHGKVENAEHNGRQVLARGHMDVGDGVLIIAGLHEVRLFDGNNWQLLVAPY